MGSGRILVGKRHQMTIRYTLLTISLLLAAVSIGYSSILILRLISGAVGRVGDDVILVSYIIPTIGLILCLFCKGLKHQTKAILVSVVAILAWLILHLGGFVYSNGNLFGGFSPW